MSLGAGTVLNCHMSSRSVGCELVRCTLSLVRRREVVSSEGGSVEETHGVDAYNYLQRFLVCSCLRCQHGRPWRPVQAGQPRLLLAIHGKHRTGRRKGGGARGKTGPVVLATRLPQCRQEPVQVGEERHSDAGGRFDASHSMTSLLI